MKRWHVALAVGLCGCGESPGIRNSSPPSEGHEVELIKQLERGDSAACVSPIVQQTIRDITIEPEDLYRYTGWSEGDRSAFEAELEVYVEGMTLNYVDATSKLISCSGTYVASYAGQRVTSPIVYEIQPTLDGSSPIVTVKDTRSTWNVLLRARRAFSKEREAAKQAIRDRTPASRNLDTARRVCQTAGVPGPSEVEYAVNFLREVPEPPSEWFDAQTWECMELISRSSRLSGAVAKPEGRQEGQANMHIGEGRSDDSAPQTGTVVIVPGPVAAAPTDP